MDTRFVYLTYSVTWRLSVRWQMGFKYAELMKNYEIAASAKGLIEMFKKAVAK